MNRKGNNTIYSDIYWDYALSPATQQRQLKAKKYPTELSKNKKYLFFSHIYYGIIILFFSSLLFFMTISISKASVPSSLMDKLEIPINQQEKMDILSNVIELENKTKQPNHTEPIKNNVTKPISFRKYRVLNRDSISKIAKIFQLNEDTIILNNNLKKASDLKAGDVLIIPNQDGKIIPVKQNDSIYKISNRYGISWKKIVDCNNLSDTTIKPGMKLFIPEAKLTEYERQKFYHLSNKQETNGIKNKNIKEKNNNSNANPILSWPVKGRITSYYGLRNDPITLVKDFHTGLDIKGNKNDPVHAAKSGTVSCTGWSKIYGNFILIKHESNMITMYGHLNRIDVKKGDLVRSGSVIGAVGTSGRTTGPHLHFEVSQNGKRINPLKFL